MRGVLASVLIFVASFAAIWVAAAAAAIAYGELAGVSQAEGAYAMGAIFFIGPAAGLIGAIIVTAVFAARRRRTNASQP